MEDENNVTVDNAKQVLGIACKICGNFKEMNPIEYMMSNIFPLCDECLSDLKEIVLAKRNSKQPTYD